MAESFARAPGWQLARLKGDTLNFRAKEDSKMILVKLHFFPIFSLFFSSLPSLLPTILFFIAIQGSE